MRKVLGIMGVSGPGKTNVGELLAAKLDWPSFAVERPVATIVKTNSSQLASSSKRDGKDGGI